MIDIRKETLHGVKWTAIEKFSVQLVNFLLGLLLARLLSPTDFGTIGMLGIFFAISQTFIDSGFSNALIRKQDVSDKDYSTAFFFNIAVGLLCYILLFCSSGLISNFFKTPALKSIIKVYAIVLFINSLTSAQYAKLNHDMNFKLQARISFMSSLMSGILGVVLAYLGFGVWALVWQAISSAAIRALLLWVFAHWRPLLTFSKSSFRYLFSYGSKLLASGLLHTIYSNLSSFAIGRYYSAEDLGYYSRGNQFATLPSSSITSILQKVTFPLFAKIQDDDSRLIAVYRKYISITSLVIFFLMTLLAALAKPLILFLLTDKWINAAVFLQIFCFALMFDHICQLNLNLLQVKGRSDLFLRLEIIKKSISLTMLIIAIPMGVKAICISSVIYTQIAVFINTYYSGRLFGLGYIAQLKDYFKYLVAAVLSCTPAFLLTLTSMPSFIILVIGSLVSFSLYILLMRNDKYYKEIKDTAMGYIFKK